MGNMCNTQHCKTLNIMIKSYIKHRDNMHLDDTYGAVYVTGGGVLAFQAGRV